MNTNEAIEKGYRLAITGVDHHLVDLDEATIEDLKRAIIIIANDRDIWKSIASELHTWLMPDFEDDEIAKAGVYAMDTYEKAVRGE